MELARQIYVDNNANTLMPTVVKDEIYKWMNTGNPSAIYANKVGTTDLIERFKKKVADVAELDQNDYSIIITSGASESNNFILRAAITGFSCCTQRLPHIIVSATEHKSLLECAIDLKNEKRIELTIVKPGANGIITAEMVRPFIQVNTCLVCVMDANNETGVANEVYEIGRMLASMADKAIAFHVDCVQTFGKFPVRPTRRGITSFSASFHKLHGPPGIGILVVYKRFIDGFHIRAEICGAQNDGLRGGTENIPYIGGAMAAMHETFKDRDKKNRYLLGMQLYTLKALSAKIPTSFFENWDEHNIKSITGIPDYKGSGHPPNLEMVVFGTSIIEPTERPKFIVPNTLMVAFIRHNHRPEGETFVEGGGDVPVNARPVCNYKLANKLMDAGVIVGLGSACNTGKGSYVLGIMGVPKVVMNSAIRISYGDRNSDEDAKVVVREILLALKGLL